MATERLVLSGTCSTGIFAVRLGGRGTRPERVRMEFARELLDCVDQARSRAVNFVADDRNMVLLHGVKILPDGPAAEVLCGDRAFARVAGGENEIVRLKTDDYFEAQLRPILVRHDHRFGARPMQRIGDERVLPDGDERIEPDDKNTRTGGRLARRA